MADNSEKSMDQTGGNSNLSYIGSFAILAITLSVIIMTYVRRDYNHFEDPFSDLGELNSPYYVFFNLFVFIIPGICTYYFFLKLDILLGISPKETRYIRIASIGWILTGIFPISYSIEWLYILHIAAAIIAFVFAPLGIIAIALQTSPKVGWTNFSISSVIIGFSIWISILLLDLYLHESVAQLISIILFFFWYIWLIILTILGRTDQ